MKKTLIIAIFLASLVLSSSMPISLATEVLNWSDDFSDGNYDGWTVEDGQFAVTDGKLCATVIGAGDAFPRISHQSNTSFGTWSFDVGIGSDPVVPPVHIVIWFMSSDSRDYVLEYLGNWILSVNWLGTVLGSYPAEAFWEHHIVIERTRDDPNHFKFYHNGTLAFTSDFTLVPDNEYTTFTFAGVPGTENAWIDNINIVYEPESTTTETTSDTTTSEDPTTTDTTTSSESGNLPDMTTILLIAGGGIAVLVVIVIVVKMRS